MITFKQFITSLHEQEDHSNATMKAIAGNPEADRHAMKYFTPDLLSRHHYLVSRPHGNAASGDLVRVHGVAVIDGKYHAVTPHGHIPIDKLHKPKVGRAAIRPDQKESLHLQHLADQIQAAKGDNDHIVIHTTHGPMRVDGVANIPKTPKADMALTYKGQHVYYISHKDGTTYNDFQQFGGVSAHKDHPAVQAFVRDMKREHPNGIGRNLTRSRVLDKTNPDHRHLIMSALFGNEYASGTHGIENVHAIIQGKMNLVPRADGTYNLTAHHVIKHGEIPEDMKPVIYARYISDRSNLGLPQTRIGIGDITARKKQVPI